MSSCGFCGRQNSPLEPIRTYQNPVRDNALPLKSAGRVRFCGFLWVLESSCPRQRSPWNPRNPLTSVCLNAQSAATLPIEPIELIDPIDLSPPECSVRGNAPFYAIEKNNHSRLAVVCYPLFLILSGSYSYCIHPLLDSALLSELSFNMFNISHCEYIGLIQ